MFESGWNREDRGERWGIAPAGAVVEVEEMMVIRFDGEPLVEMWENCDEATRRRQIAVD